MFGSWMRKISEKMEAQKLEDEKAIEEAAANGDDSHLSSSMLDDAPRYMTFFDN